MTRALVGPPVLLSAAALEFVTERRLATLTTHRRDGSAHVVPVGFTWDAGPAAPAEQPLQSLPLPLVRVTMRSTSRKARHIAAGGQAGARVVLCSLDGPRWITLEGTAVLSADPEEVAGALRRYAVRYQREPAHDPLRVVAVVAVDRVMSSSHLR